MKRDGIPMTWRGYVCLGFCSAVVVSAILTPRLVWWVFGYAAAAAVFCVLEWRYWRRAR